MGDFMSFRGTFMRIDGEKNTQVIDRKIGHLELCLVNIIELTFGYGYNQTHGIFIANSWYI